MRLAALAWVKGGGRVEGEGDKFLHIKENKCMLVNKTNFSVICFMQQILNLIGRRDMHSENCPEKGV